MSAGQRRCLMCTCEQTMPLDATALSKAIGAVQPMPLHQQLCRSQLRDLQEAVGAGDPLLVLCRQEASLFAEINTCAERPVDMQTLDIRHAAGWSKESGEATPKIAALIRQAMLPAPDVAGLSMESRGRCLIAGHAEQVVPAAERLAGTLEVTVVIHGGEPPPSLRAGVNLLRGRLTSLRGHLGRFEARLEDVAMPTPSARERMQFGPPRAELTAQFDCVLDLRGGTALVQAPEKRDGYVRAEPNDLLAIERAIFDVAQFVGQFEKPRYVDLDAPLCAHSRSGKVGCHRCLDHCPTGAITPAGEHVSIDPFVCAGCGSCAALCPTGAIVYANPSPNHLLDRLRVLLSVYAAEGGPSAKLLLHDHRLGEPLIEAMARYGDGLPAEVIPFALDEVTQVSLEVILGAFAYGAAEIVALLPWKAAPEAISLETNIGFANAILAGLGYGDDRMRLLFEDDPDALSGTLWSWQATDHACRATFLSLGGKRERLRLALDALHAAADSPPATIALPDAAPLGNVVIDVEGCTLCLACVGACPTGALIDNPDTPMLRFLEDACIQCGLCQNTCPEKVIKLEPRVNFSSEAKSPRLVKEEAPALCTRCGKAFGVRSSVERIIAQLASKHSMFQSAEQVARLSMCEDCRVAVQFEAKDNPFQGGPRARTKTTDDYLREREELEEARRRLDPKSRS